MRRPATAKGFRAAKAAGAQRSFGGSRLSYANIDLGIRGRAIGLLARVLYPICPPDRASRRQGTPLSGGSVLTHETGRLRDGWRCHTVQR
jgi:hypothetical protein